MTSNLFVLGRIPPRFQKELSLFKPVTLTNPEGLKKELDGQKAFLLILGKDPGVNRIALSIEISSTFEGYTLLLMESDELDQAIYQCAQYPVFVISYNSSQTVFYQTVRFLQDLVLEKEKMETVVRKEKERFNNEKIVNRAKLLLVEKLHYSEEQAHHYIQKKAMDHSMTRVAVARLVINRLKG